MESIGIGDSGLQGSRIALGTWAIGGWMWGGNEEADGLRTVQTAVDRGITLLDTAPVYGFGRSEEIVGKAISEEGRRDRVLIATKAGLAWESGAIVRDSSPGRLRFELDQSLRRLRTDRIDLYQIHWPDPSTPFEETASELARFHKSGKIRAIGVLTGWALDAEGMADIEAMLRRTIHDPVGPEFMAPPCRAA